MSSLSMKQLHCSWLDYMLRCYGENTTKTLALATMRLSSSCHSELSAATKQRPERIGSRLLHKLMRCVCPLNIHVKIMTTTLHSVMVLARQSYKLKCGTSQPSSITHCTATCYSLSATRDSGLIPTTYY